MGYDVHGIVRRNSLPNSQSYRLESIEKEIHTYYGDLLDQTSLDSTLAEVKPDEIYNLGAQSHVRISYDIPQYTSQVNAIGVLNLLESYKKICPEAKLYQASTSEMFGLNIDDDNFQRETTVLNPVSPYGISKVFAYGMVRHYRRAYDLHACNGILFNHESPRRGDNFVTSKVVKSACMIKLGRQEKLELGNMDSYRDWGHAKDYVKTMHLIINHETADDFVVSTMETRSVRDMCDIVFKYLDLNYMDYVVQNPKFMRAEELPYLRGDSTKMRNTFNWKPTYTFEEMMYEMTAHWMDVLQGIKSKR
jgi:GDPmannose 4,6-dehydratase